MVMANHEFSVGALHGWHGVLLGLLGSALFLIDGRQDWGRFNAGAAFWFFFSLYSLPVASFGSAWGLEFWERYCWA
jgi:hypothetical protein